jgi:hypothetical protein
MLSSILVPHSQHQQTILLNNILFYKNMLYYDLYSSPNILIVIKLSIMGWLGHVAGIEEKSIQDSDGVSCRKETIWKTKAQLGEKY